MKMKAPCWGLFFASDKVMYLGKIYRPSLELAPNKFLIRKNLLPLTHQENQYLCELPLTISNDCPV